MNQPFNNPAQPPQNQPVAPAGGPFEQPTQPVVPQPQPQSQPQPPGDPNQPPSPYGFQSMEPPHEGGGKTWILIVVLLIVLILGGLVFASWEGWISLGGVESLWKKDKTTSTETASTTPTNTSTTTKTTTNTNDATRKSDLASIKAALKKYYQANQAYPIATAVQKTSDATTALKVLVPTYIAKLPVDPLSPTKYYGYKSDGKTFELTCVLEDTTDPAGIKTGTLYIYKVTDTSTETSTTSSQTTTDSTTTTITEE